MDDDPVNEMFTLDVAEAWCIKEAGTKVQFEHAAKWVEICLEQTRFPSTHTLLKKFLDIRVYD